MDDYGEYTSEPCEHCGRVRVLEYGDGKKICEKCFWNQDTHTYDRSHVGICE